jgi:outer membrane biosynthesis protein TonB
VALTDDQKAMLRLLAQREEGYEDMAALMGISVEEVRERVKDALAEVGQPEAAAEEPPEAPTPPPLPTPPAPEPPQPAPDEPPAAVVAPTGDQSQKPVAKDPAPSGHPAKRAPQFSGLKLPKDRGALIGLGAGALVVVIFVVVLLVSGGDGGSDSSTTSAEGSQESTTAASEDPNLTQAVLSPVDGSDAEGGALFGRFKKRVLLQVTAKGLEPSETGQSYAVWLSHSGDAMVPVGTATVPDSGDLAARFQIPAAVLVLVARNAFDEVNVTRTDDATLSAAIAKARKSKAESAYTGTDVLGGKITGPIVSSGAKNQG